MIRAVNRVEKIKAKDANNDGNDGAAEAGSGGGGGGGAGGEGAGLAARRWLMLKDTQQGLRGLQSMVDGQTGPNSANALMAIEEADEEEADINEMIKRERAVLKGNN